MPSSAVCHTLPKYDNTFTDFTEINIENMTVINQKSWFSVFEQLTRVFSTVGVTVENTYICMKWLLCRLTVDGMIIDINATTCVLYIHTSITTHTFKYIYSQISCYAKNNPFFNATESALFHKEKQDLFGVQSRL